MENSINSNNYNDDEHVTHSKSDNIKTMISDEADQVIKNLFE